MKRTRSQTIDDLFFFEQYFKQNIPKSLMSIISKIGIDRIMGYFFLTITIGKSGNYCIMLKLLYYCNHIANE